MYLDKNRNRWFKLGLHIHTSLSDGKKTPQEMARIYKNAGFDAVAVTDHWLYHAEDEIEGLTVISGIEYDVGSDDAEGGTMHIVGFGMNKEPKIDKISANRQEIVNQINECGGFAVVAHPYWSLNDKKDIKDLSGISFIEIYNSVSDACMSNRADSSYLIESLANDGVIIPVIATDDSHYYNEQDHCRSFVMVKAKSGRVVDLLQAMKEGAYYSSQGPHLTVTRQNDKIIAECSPCQKIAFMSNAVWANDRMVRADCVERAEYQIKEHEKWLRVEVTDYQGNRAWSNIISL